MCENNQVYNPYILNGILCMRKTMVMWNNCNCFPHCFEVIPMLFQFFWHKYLLLICSNCTTLIWIIVSFISMGGGEPLELYCSVFIWQMYTVQFSTNIQILRHHTIFFEKKCKIKAIVKMIYTVKHTTCRLWNI